jgi:hypothetical protein
MAKGSSEVAQLPDVMNVRVCEVEIGYSLLPYTPLPPRLHPITDVASQFINYPVLLQITHREL